MPCLLKRYLAQLELIKRYQFKYRENTPVRLLAVSKTKPADDVLALYKSGQRDFGENYLQEAALKQKALAHLAINWHFIGPIQSNKTREIANSFQWVHSVDRLKIAKRLHQQRPAHLPPINICLQVNLDEEETKSGFLLDELLEAVEQIQSLDKLRVRGLMAIPKPQVEMVKQRRAFKQLGDAMRCINDTCKLSLDTLSMGMSGDIEAAIAEGATMVRIGTAIFGERPKRNG